MQASDHNHGNGTGEAFHLSICESDTRRADILEVAKKLFIEKGYKATTVAEIAAGANLAVGTVYKFFKDKNTLYFTLMSEIMREFESGVLKTLRETEGDETTKLGRCIDFGAALFVKHLPFISVHYGEMGMAFLHPAAGLHGELALAYDRIMTALTQLCRDGVEKQLFVDMDPAEMVRGLVGVHGAYLAAIVQNPGCYTAEQIAELTKRVFFNAMLNQSGSRCEVEAL